MQQTTIQARPRTTTGKGSARAARREGMIPAIVYSHFTEPVSITVNPKELGKAVTGSDRGFNTVLQIKIENGQTKTALLKDWQVDPVDRHLLHADFVEIRMDEKHVSSVPVRLVGKPQGVVDGGIMTQIRRELDVKCLPVDIPVEIVIDIAHLKLNEALHVSDVTPPEGVEIPYNNDFTIAVITHTEGGEATEKGEASTETEPASE